MSKVFRPWKTDEVWLLPPSVADFVPAGHPAYLIRDLVSEELDLSAIMGAYTELKGYPPYHPAMMVALLLYAYRSGVYSSRRIARGCGAAGLRGGDRAEPAGFPHDQRVPAASPRCPGGPVRAGAGGLPQGRPGRARPCRGGRHEDQGQCLQAQGDELRPDGRGRGRTRPRGGRVAGPRPRRGCGRGRRARQHAARRRAAGLDARQAGPADAHPRCPRRACSRGPGGGSGQTAAAARP